MFLRGNNMDENLRNKLPKKWHKYIKDIYKESKRYSVVIQFEDGFSRSIGDKLVAKYKKRSLYEVFFYIYSL